MDVLYRLRVDLFKYFYTFFGLQMKCWIEVLGIVHRKDFVPGTVVNHT